MQKSEFEEKKPITDKFAIFYIPIDDSNVDKHNVESYIRSNQDS